LVGIETRSKYAEIKIGTIAPPRLTETCVLLTPTTILGILHLTQNNRTSLSTITGPRLSIEVTGIFTKLPKRLTNNTALKVSGGNPIPLTSRSRKKRVNVETVIKYMKSSKARYRNEKGLCTILLSFIPN
jgi:hypothetical protein